MVIELWKTIKSFYNSKEWIKFRLNIIAERSIRTDGLILCEYCRKIISEVGDVEIDHVKELTQENVNDYLVSLNPENVKIYCHSCHNKKHGRFGHKRERGIYLVYGSPLAGKKTFVKENMVRGDMVIDMDSLFSAISFFNLYDTVEPLKYNVFAVRNLLLDNVKTRYGRFNNVWIIGGYANKHDRERIANDLGAELIFLDVDQEECIRRLGCCDDYRRYQANEWKKFIARWFEEYRA